VGVVADTFPHRSTGEPAIGLGPWPAKVALWKGICHHFKFSNSAYPLILVTYKSALNHIYMLLY